MYVMVSESKGGGEGVWVIVRVRFRVTLFLCESRLTVSMFSLARRGGVMLCLCVCVMWCGMACVVR